MYTVNQGPSKLVAKTRTGLSQNYDKIESIRKMKNASGAHIAKGQNSNNRLNNDNSDVNAMDISVAKPVFQHYRRSNSNRNHNNTYKTVRISGFNDDDTQPIPSPQYEELIRYIRDSWNVLSTECENVNERTNTLNDNNSTIKQSSTGDLHVSDSVNRTTTTTTATTTATTMTTSNRRKVVMYHNEAPSPALVDFGPFDLESFWGRRLFNNITKSL